MKSQYWAVFWVGAFLVGFVRFCMTWPTVDQALSAVVCAWSAAALGILVERAQVHNETKKQFRREKW